MTVDMERGSKSAADSLRREHTQHVSDRDDARLNTVRFPDSAPEWLIERAEVTGFEDRAECGRLPGEQAELTKAELN